MHFGRFQRKTLLAATLILAFGTANAALLEQTGTPSSSPVTMKTYGVDVSTRVGLKSVIPAGWQLFVHKSVELPESLSWKVDESWVSVLNNFARTNSIAVLLDWDKKAVYFRSTEMAVQEHEKRQMITQAAATPLPSFTAVAELAATPDLTTTTATVVVTSPTVASTSLPVAAPVKAPVVVMVSVPQLAPAPSEAPQNSTMDNMLAAASLPIVTNSTNAQSSSIVTVTPTSRRDGSTTVEVTRPALAVAGASPKVTVVSTTGTASVEARSSSIVVAQPSVTQNPPKVTVVSVPSSSAAMPSTPLIEAPAQVIMVQRPAAAVQPSVAPATLVVAIRPVALVAPAAYVEQTPAMEPTAGEAFNRQAVDMVIKTAADKHGYTVSWEAADVQFPGAVTILGADMGEDMKLVLRALGGRRSPISIDVYRSSSIVRVRNASGAAEVAFVDMPFQGAIREKSAPSFTVKVRPDAVQAPTYVVAPAVSPVRVAVFSTTPSTVIVEPARTVIAEPARMDTAVENIKKLAPAAAVEFNNKPFTEQTAFETAAPAHMVTLRVEQGSALRQAVEALLEPGWTLKWDVNGDMEANTKLEVSGESLAAVLNKVLPRLALSADIYKPSKLVVVRPADSALDK